MKLGNVNPTTEKALHKIISKLSNSDIYVEACEKFGGKSLTDIRNIILDFINEHGELGLIIIDYLELCDVGDGISYGPNHERFRQDKISRTFKEWAMEFNCVVASATQSSAVEVDLRNDSDFVYTRWNLSEAKGKIRPTDIFVTINQTADEKKAEMIRLYIDKAREHGGGQVIPLYTNFSRSRFYDKKKSIEGFLERRNEELN